MEIPTLGLCGINCDARPMYHHNCGFDHRGAIPGGCGYQGCLDYGSVMGVNGRRFSGFFGIHAKKYQIPLPKTVNGVSLLKRRVIKTSSRPSMMGLLEATGSGIDRVQRQEHKALPNKPIQPTSYSRD